MLPSTSQRILHSVRTWIQSNQEKSLAQTQILSAEKVPSAALKILPTLSSLYAWFALYGDKSAVITRSLTGIWAFRETSSHVIALADPCGTIAARKTLQSAMLEHADHQHKRLVVYHASSAYAKERVAAGMRAYKLGEEAIVPLRGLEIGKLKSKAIGQNLRKLEREGLRFELIMLPDATILQQAEKLSAQWLARKRAREKQFSLGRFDAIALAKMPMALVWKDDELLAFANLLTSADYSCLSVDLMRYGDGAPGGVMDYLFARLMLWGREQGYERFSLGMAPLSGSADAVGTRYWAALSQMIFRHAERFYNFQGVRRFKEKWSPQWEPRYLLVERRFDALPALADCALLIAGGKRALLGSKINMMGRRLRNKLRAPRALRRAQGPSAP
jgi:phosphatidylglycerol lysyltransferase